jgi:predicted nucleotidyltransferase component of viral defense system
MIKEWIASYAPKTQVDYTLVLREVMQRIALAGLYRGGFFEQAAFYGGTALRIFYDLPRFSEDLDFSLLETRPDFPFERYLKAVEDEFLAHGMEVAIRIKKKTGVSAVQSAFLKPATTWSELVLETVVPQMGLSQNTGVKIKIEIDTAPALGFTTEEKLLLQPFSFYVKCFTLEDLFAGKMHALLFRKWKQNVKGRDWFDLEWYVRKGVALNLAHFENRARDSGDWTGDMLSEQAFRDLLQARIDDVNLDRVIADIRRFIPDPQVLSIWSKTYFHDLVAMLKVTK